MDFWRPKPIWQGDDVYIVGGGPSLASFNWQLLFDRLVIGCNSAFRLGVEVCDICIFGDRQFLTRNFDGLEQYSGLVVTNQRFPDAPPWLKMMQRIPRGLSKTALAWNGNTGSAAINLALILGAKRVYLLGFDMHLSASGKANWHEFSYDRPDAKSYQRFIAGFKYLADALPKVFSDRQVINVNDNTDLRYFPIESVKEHFGLAA